MKIVVAGAGAGKTTSMAQVVLNRLKGVTNGKIIYVITYTNAARDRIREKIIELNGSIPKQLFIETSHVFLLREYIFPFHHLLFDQQYNKASQIKLSDNQGFKAAKIKELATNKMIHVEKVTETAKWIICRKTGDTKGTREKRIKLLAIVSRYLDSVFIDEAQDMDKHLLEIIGALNGTGIDMYLVGDPKQDLRGRNAFKEIVTTYQEQVKYIPENHRCPISHVNLANMYITKAGQQTSQTSEVGNLTYVFESDIAISDFIEKGYWDHRYIYKKNSRFFTNENEKYLIEQNLSYELRALVKKSGTSEREIDKRVFSLKKEILPNLNKENNFKIFSKIEKLLSVTLTSQDKGKLSHALDLIRESPRVDGIIVNSIDSIKGLEGNDCLFILTTDLAPYLFFEKTEQNKMVNYLYVALTRSRRELCFLVTTEVEERYSRDTIKTFFKRVGVNLLVYT